MISNSEVIRAWTQGRSAKAGNLRTDGYFLWSYKLIIGTSELGKEVLQFTANGNRGFFSMTTSRHVGMANRQIVNKN